jgi:capsular exopolysaccharide synthesis family protein
VGNVWDAIRKHQAEQAAQAPAAPPPEAGASPVAPPAPLADAPSATTTAPSPAARPAPQIIAPRQSSEALGRANTDNYSSVLMPHHDRGGQIAEQYRSLRTNLLARYADERFSTLITSAEAGEGKTVTCVNLAMVLSERQERRTVIVDCDLRRSKVASLLKLPAARGLTDLLRGTCRISDVVQATAYPNLSVVQAGQAKYEEIGELVHRPELDEIIAELRQQYDYVLVDTPPINTVSDAGVIGRAVNDALLVVRMNRTHKESVERAMRLLSAANVKITGIVLTHQEYYIPHYLYRYS